MTEEETRDYVYRRLLARSNKATLDRMANGLIELGKASIFKLEKKLEEKNNEQSK